jgi:hypothetical protein
VPAQEFARAHRTPPLGLDLQEIELAPVTGRDRQPVSARMDDSARFDLVASGFSQTW